MKIGERVKYFRTLANMSSYKLAEKASVTPAQITNIETNANSASLDSLDRICKALGITLAQFFSEEAIIQTKPSEIDKLLFVAKKLSSDQIQLLINVALNLSHTQPALPVTSTDINDILDRFNRYITELESQINQLKNAPLFSTVEEVYRHLTYFRNYNDNEEKLWNQLSNISTEDLHEKKAYGAKLQEQMRSTLSAKLYDTRFSLNKSGVVDQKLVNLIDTLIDGLESYKIYSKDFFDNIPT